MYLVTPYPPAPSDLLELDRLRRSVSSGRNGWAHGYLLHEARLQDPDNRRLITWIRGRRRLSTRVHDRVPKLLGL